MSARVRARFKVKKNFTDLCRLLVHCIFGYYFCLHFIAISWCQVLHPVVWAQAQKSHVDQLSIRLFQNGGGATALGEAVHAFFAA